MKNVVYNIFSAAILFWSSPLSNKLIKNNVFSLHYNITCSPIRDCRLSLNYIKSLKNDIIYCCVSVSMQGDTQILIPNCYDNAELQSRQRVQTILVKARHILRRHHRLLKKLLTYTQLSSGKKKLKMTNM